MVSGWRVRPAVTDILQVELTPRSVVPPMVHPALPVPPRPARSKSKSRSGSCRTAQLERLEIRYELERLRLGNFSGQLTAKLWGIEGDGAKFTFAKLP